MPEKYDRIGVGYNQTRKADPYLLSRIESFLEPQKNGYYLDIGCGTGNYTIKLAEKGYRFAGVEPSEKMLEIARKRNSSVNWIQGSAESIPLDDATVDGVVASLTLHHWKNLYKGMSEIARILKPGACFVVFTSDPKQMEGYWLNHYFPKMLHRSIVQMPKLALVKEAMKFAQMDVVKAIPYFVRNDLEDHFLYVGKAQPELYLKPEIRKGISSFADLVLQDEVKTGLQKLESDLQSGVIWEIIHEYENELGDYLFIKSIKRA